MPSKSSFNARAVRRFFLTPKGLLILIFVPMVLMAAPGAGWSSVGRQVAAAVALPALVDVFILRARLRRWEFPSGAILTGLIVMMLVDPRTPWYASAAATLVGVVSKQVFRVQSANVFNPAAFGLVTTFWVFHPAQSWWGALPNLPLAFIVFLIGTGVFITDRVNKMPLVQAFLGVYFLLFTITAFGGDASHAAAIFRPPDLNAALYFAFFILTDPPTSPVKPRDQIICGIIVAVGSFAIFETLRSVYYLLGGVLIGNLWDARRRGMRGQRSWRTSRL